MAAVVVTIGVSGVVGPAVSVGPVPIVHEIGRHPGARNVLDALQDGLVDGALTLRHDPRQRIRVEGRADLATVELLQAVGSDLARHLAHEGAAIPHDRLVARFVDQRVNQISEMELTVLLRH